MRCYSDLKTIAFRQAHSGFGGRTRTLPGIDKRPFLFRARRQWRQRKQARHGPCARVRRVDDVIDLEQAGSTVRLAALVGFGDNFVEFGLALLWVGDRFEFFAKSEFDSTFETSESGPFLFV